MSANQNNINKDVLAKAFELLCTAKAMTELYEENFKIGLNRVDENFF